MNLTALKGYTTNILFIINFLLIPALIALALITFLWGVYNYFILGAASDDKRAEGRQFVLWGLIGFVVIISVWGLVFVVGSTLGFFPESPMNLAPPAPKI